ncbi:MAG TPA: hypothetical protein VE713_06145 [Pyrinomonadaceae bacterium]|jgi:hypothetical protein|nr:hypothetical protein [Pyrinomonadaceae bacterium]
MAKFTNPLEGVRVAAPCRADWEKMVGDERTRYCGQCSLHVYNLSGMTRSEAEALIMNAEGRLCVRFYRRADGSVMTRNCPVGLRALKQRVSRVAGATLSAVLGFFAGVGLNLGFAPATPHVMGTIALRPVRQEEVEVPPPPPVPEDAHVMMGAVGFRTTGDGKGGRRK